MKHILIVFMFVGFFSCTDQNVPKATLPTTLAFTFDKEKTMLSKFALAANYTKFSEGGIDDLGYFSFMVSRKDGLSNFKASIKNSNTEVEIITRGLLRNSQKSVVKIWPDKKKAIIDIDGIKTKIETEEDFKYLTKDVEKILVHSIVLFQEVTIISQEEFLHEKRKQECATIGLGGTKSLASERAVGQGDDFNYCSCSKPKGPDCGCLWGDFMCICMVTWTCDCNGPCGEIGG